MIFNLSVGLEISNDEPGTKLGSIKAIQMSTSSGYLRRDSALYSTITCIIEITAPILGNITDLKSFFIDEYPLSPQVSTGNLTKSKRIEVLAKIMADILHVASNNVIIFSVRNGKNANIAVLAVAVSVTEGQKLRVMESMAVAFNNGQLSGQLATQLVLRSPICRCRSPPQLFGPDGFPETGPDDSGAPSATFVVAAVLPTIFIVAALAVWVRRGSALEQLALNYHHVTARKDSALWAKIEAVSTNRVRRTVLLPPQCRAPSSFVDLCGEAQPIWKVDQRVLS